MLCCHVDDPLVAGRRGDVKEIFEELKRKVDDTHKEGTRSTKYLGGRLEIKDDGVIFGGEPKYVGNILEEIGLRDLKRTIGLKWETEKEGEEPELDGLGQAEYRSLVGQPIWLDRTDVKEAPNWAVRRSWTAKIRCPSYGT